MARKTKTASRLPLDERTPDQKELEEGYAALLKILYSKPWYGMTTESILADADAIEADLDALPLAHRLKYDGVIEDARRYIAFARTAAARGDVPTAWEWMGSAVRARRVIRGETR